MKTMNSKEPCLNNCDEVHQCICLKICYKKNMCHYSWAQFEIGFYKKCDIILKLMNWIKNLFKIYYFIEKKNDFKWKQNNFSVPIYVSKKITPLKLE